MLYILVLFLGTVAMILAVSFNGHSTTFATTIMCLTNIKILTVVAIVIIFKDILNDCKMSVLMTVSRLNLILNH
jgi:hypothetical protein